jgi:hypothetical protein
MSLNFLMVKQLFTPLLVFELEMIVSTPFISPFCVVNGVDDVQECDARLTGRAGNESSMVAMQLGP